MRKKSIRRHLWKTLNVLALASLVLHMSAAGVFLTPASAANADVETPVLTGETQLSLTSGAVWTTTSSCGEDPQDENHYHVGDHVYVNGSGFIFADNPYSWDINSVPPGTPVASGTQNVNENGTFCFDAHTVQPDDSGEYKVTFGNKHDNYRVDHWTSTIGGTKINDLDHNGSYTTSEPALAGWQICVYALEGKVPIDCTETAVGDGGWISYTLPDNGNGLPAGQYRVCETQQDGWTSQNPDCRTVEINGEDDIHHIDFFNYAVEPPVFQLNGFKWNDLDGNGDWERCPVAVDLCEPGLPGWVINLYQNDAASATPFASAITDSNGAYAFGDLPPGVYTICEEQQTGWAQTWPGTKGGCYYGVTLGETTAGITEFNFGNKLVTGMLRVFKHVEGGDAASSEWSLHVTKDNADVANSPLPGSEIGTDYVLTPGSYRVSETGGAEGYSASFSESCIEDGWVTVPAGQLVTCTITNTRDTGSVTVHKQLDSGDGFVLADGDGYPFRWGLDGDSPARAMGSTENNVPSGPHQVTENDVPGYHVVGWFPTGPEKYSCERPPFTDLPASIAVTGGQTTTIVICNAINPPDTRDLWVTKRLHSLHLVRESADLPPSDEQFLVSVDYGNTGSATASDVVICDPLASYWQAPPISLLGGEDRGYADTDVNPCGTPRTMWWKVGDLEPGESGSVTAVLNESSDPGDYPGITRQYCGLDNTATISTEGNGWNDNNTENNTASATHAHVCPLIPQFSLTVSKDDGVATVNPGGTLTYTINWSLTSFGEVPNAVITDVLPDNVSFVSASDSGNHIGGSTGGTVTWNLGDLNPAGPSYMMNGSETVTVDALLPLDPGTLIHNAGNFCYGAPNAASESGIPCVPFSDDTTVTSDFALTLDKTDNTDPVLAGAPITYTLSWSITGDAPAHNVTLKDVLPAQLTFVNASDGGIHNGVNPGGEITWNLGDRNPGASGLFTVVAAVSQGISGGTSILNLATLSAEKHVLGGDIAAVAATSANGALSAPGVQIVTVSANADETTTVIDPPVAIPRNPVVEIKPLLTIDKTVAQPTVQPGDHVSYSVVVKNTGNGAANNVVLTDVLPAGLTFADTGTTTRSWSIAAIFAAGDSTIISYPVAAAADIALGSYVNTASLISSNHPSVSDTANVTVALPVVLGAATPALTVEKKANVEVVNIGDEVTYTIVVRNTGDGEATGVVLKDFLPDGFSFTDDQSSLREWTIGTLGAKQSATFVYTTAVTTAAAPGSHDNLARVEASGLDPVEAKAPVHVAEGKVLGATTLADTGVRPSDYLIFLSGTLLLFLAAMGFRKSAELA